MQSILIDSEITNDILQRTRKTHLAARKLTKTVQLLDRASKASLWIDVFGGKTPFANREIIVRGKAKSSRQSQLSPSSY